TSNQSEHTAANSLRVSSLCCSVCVTFKKLTGQVEAVNVNKSAKGRSPGGSGEEHSSAGSRINISPPGFIMARLLSWSRMELEVRLISTPKSLSRGILSSVQSENKLKPRSYPRSLCAPVSPETKLRARVECQRSSSAGTVYGMEASDRREEDCAAVQLQRSSAESLAPRPPEKSAREYTTVVAAVGDGNPHGAFTHDLWVASIFITVRVEVQLR
ncbi:Cytochrome P450 4g15, partial [Dissostichus eleginoides]